jgi:hypothetical protein
MISYDVEKNCHTTIELIQDITVNEIDGYIATQDGRVFIVPHYSY